LAIGLQFSAACGGTEKPFRWTEFRFGTGSGRAVSVPVGWVARWPNRGLEEPVALVSPGDESAIVWASNLSADWAAESDVRRRLRGLAMRSARGWSSVTIVVGEESVACEVTRDAPWAAACGSRPKPRAEAGTAAHVDGLSAGQWRRVGGVRRLAEIAARSGYFEEP
jgi:hypothetical protein